MRLTWCCRVHEIEQHDFARKLRFKVIHQVVNSIYLLPSPQIPISWDTNTAWGSTATL